MSISKVRTGPLSGQAAVSHEVVLPVPQLKQLQALERQANAAAMVWRSGSWPPQSQRPYLSWRSAPSPPRPAHGRRYPPAAGVACEQPGLQLERGVYDKALRAAGITREWQDVPRSSVRRQVATLVA